MTIALVSVVGRTILCFCSVLKDASNRRDENSSLESLRDNIGI